MPYTTLEGVNEILEGIGQPPVTALDTGGTSEEAEAETFLDRYNERVQRTGPGIDPSLTLTGWSQNTDPDRTLGVVGGAIFATNILQFETINASAYLDLTIRGGAFYNVTTATATFTDSINVATVDLLAFTSLTDRLAELVIAAAAMQYQRYKKRGNTDDAYLRDRYYEARLAAERESFEQVPLSVLRSASIVDVKGRRRPRYNGIY